MKAHAVYRLFDAQDRALYIGCTLNPTARLNDHTHKPWWCDVARVEVTLHPIGSVEVEMLERSWEAT